jgi:hypothetical protein
MNSESAEAAGWAIRIFSLKMVFRTFFLLKLYSLSRRELSQKL